MNKLALTLFSCLLILASCNDSDDDGSSNVLVIKQSTFDPTDEAEFRAALDGGSEKIWTAVAFTLNNRTTVTDCRLDDIMTFKSDGTYFYQRGVSCGDEDDDHSEKTGTWEVNFDDRSITFDAGTSDEETGVFIGLSSDEIRIQGSYFLLQVRGIYTSN